MADLLAKLVPKAPTVEGVLKKYMPKGTYSGADRRKRKRITVEQLNRLGVEKLGLTKEDLRPKDRRSAATKVFDWLDLPRNIVAQAIGSLVGVKKQALPKGALGLPKVYMSDVLKKLRVRNKVTRGIVGFLGDVLIDPLTYITLGATTGTQVSKALPKILKPGMKQFSAAAKALVAGGPLPKSVVGALGGKAAPLRRLAAKYVKRYGEKAALKKLMTKRGGRLTRLLERMAFRPGTAKGARQFIAKYGEKGRTLLRAPYAAKGVTARWGKRKRLYEAITAPDATLQAIAPKLRKIRKASAAAAAPSKIPVEHQKIIDRMVKAWETKYGKKMTPQGIRGTIRSFYKGGWKEMGIPAPKGGMPAPMKAGKLRKLGKKAAEAAAEVKAITSAPDAGLPWRLRHAARYGATRLKAPGALNTFRRVTQYLFGPGASEAGRVAAGGRHAMHAGAQVAKNQVTAGFIKIVKPAVDDIAAKTGQSADDVMSYVFDLMEKGGKYHAADPIKGRLRDAIKQFGGHEGLQKAVAEGKKFLSESWLKQKRAGVEPGWVKGFMAREGHPDFQKYMRALGEQHGKLPFGDPRTKLLEFTKADGTVHRTLSTSKDAKAWMRAVKQQQATVSEFDISTELWNQLAQGTAPKEFMRADTGKYLGFRQIAKGYKGPRFLKDVPGALGVSAGEAERRLGAGRIADVAAEGGARLVKGQEAGVGQFAHMIDYSSYAKRTGLSKTPFHAYVGHKLEGLALPQPVVDMVERAAHVSQAPRELRVFLNATDAYLKVWRPIQLMAPAYTVRNIVENTFGMAREGINPLRAFKRLREIRRIVRAAARGQDLKGLSLTIRGIPVSAEKFAQSAKWYNMLNAGMTSMLIEPNLWARTKSMLGRAGRGWFDFNNEIENTMRLSAFAQLMDEGLTARQAALKTIRAMPDLTDLTLFEREVGRRIFPYASWMRKNGANMARLFLDKPAIVAGSEKFRRYAEMALQGDEMVDPMLRPSWMQEQQAMQITGDRDRGTVFLLAGWLPFDELIDTLAGSVNFGHFTNQMLGKIRPDAKFIAETATGMDIFKQRPVEPFTNTELLGSIPKAIVGASATPLDNILSLRPIRETRRLTEMPSVGAGVGRVILGGAIQPLTRLRAIGRRSRIVREEMERVRNAANWAKQVNDMPEYERLTRRWFQLQAELAEIGGPGVAKATKKTLRRLGSPVAEPAFAR